MKILIIAHVIYPFQSPRSFRATELAKEFALAGNDVTIYGNNGDFNYKDFETTHSLKVKGYKKLFFVKKNSSKEEKYNLFEKILIKLFRRRLQYPNVEYLFSIKDSLKNEKEFDLLISIGAPHSIHWGVAWALRENPDLTRIWVADCGDPFMGNKFENPPFYFKYLEKWFCKKVDHITVPIEQAKYAYYEEFRNKITIIPQGFCFDNVMLYEGPLDNEIPTFAFAGNLYKDRRDPALFLEFLVSLQTNFKFILYTSSLQLIAPFKNRLGIKLETKPYIPRHELLFELSKMNFLVNIENIDKEQSPSKLIDYALTKRPILSVGSNQINKLVIQEFLNGNYSNAKKINLEPYDIKNVTKQFLDLIKIV